MMVHVGTARDVIWSIHFYNDRLGSEVVVIRAHFFHRFI